MLESDLAMGGNSGKPGKGESDNETIRNEQRTQTVAYADGRHEGQYSRTMDGTEVSFSSERRVREESSPRQHQIDLGGDSSRHLSITTFSWRNPTLFTAGGTQRDTMVQEGPDQHAVHSGSSTSESRAKDAEKDELIAMFERLIAEKDDMIAEKDDMIAEKDDMIAGQDREIERLITVNEKESALRSRAEKKEMRDLLLQRAQGGYVYLVVACIGITFEIRASQFAVC